MCRIDCDFACGKDNIVVSIVIPTAIGVMTVGSTGQYTELQTGCEAQVRIVKKSKSEIGFSIGCELCDILGLSPSLLFAEATLDMRSAK